MDFQTFDFQPQIMSGIKAAGYLSPTPIQQQAIPAVLNGSDVMGLAQTGTGKTAAFALPILQRLSGGDKGYVRALIVAPTRELAEQIHEAFKSLGQQTGLNSITVYGGVGINPQIAKLKRGVEIVVACPGRLLDHIKQGTINLSKLEVLVLDEADQMFDMGFFPDIRRILKHLPSKRQTLLFSATMPKEIRHLAHEVLHDAVTIQVGNTAPAETVSHALYPVAQHLKTALLRELLKRNETESVLVFTRTKHRAKRLGQQLDRDGYRATSLQGNLSQNQRQKALDGFREGTFQILVATDIAARGIDVSQVSHVVNYDIPSTPEAYIHRIGRTGRAARKGDAFTLITNEDRGMVRAIEKLLNSAIERHTLDGFDYNAAAPPREPGQDRPQRSQANDRQRVAAKPGSRPVKNGNRSGKSAQGAQRSRSRQGQSATV
jgi:ATP-dependent RNA helicase RhlE